MITPDSKSPHLNCAVLPTRFQPQHPQRLWYDEPLLAVVRGRNTLEELEAFKGSGTAGGLVWDHTPNCSVEDLRGRAVMEGAGFFGVDNMAFMEEIMVPELLVSRGKETRGCIDGERSGHRQVENNGLGVQ